MVQRVIKALLSLRHDYFGWRFAVKSKKPFKVGEVGQSFLETFWQALAWQKGEHPNQSFGRPKSTQWIIPKLRK